MATTKQKKAARPNTAKAHQAPSAPAKVAKVTRAGALSTAEKDRLPDKDFAFPKQRKEPLTDARHVRNALARFGRVEGVTDKERDSAWRRIVRAAKRFDVEVHEKSWHELVAGGRAKPKG